MNDRFLIKEGFAYFPQEKKIRKVDIQIKDGKIEKIGEGLQAQSDTEVVDASSRLISPGFTDLHAHLREPGREDAETLESGAWAALAGGFTTVCAMPNTQPPTDTREQAAYICRRSEELGLARILPIAAITKQRAGQEIAEYALLKEGGAVGFSDDGDWVRSAEVMRRALEYAGMLGLPVITHAEEPSMCEEGMMNEGVTSARLGLAVRPPVAEIIALQRDLALAAYTSSHLHVAHLTTGAGAGLVKQARDKGLRVTAEVTPHHLLLTEQALETFDANYKVNPPLRTDEDRKTLIAALSDGTVHGIATDHAPHTLEEKEQEIDLAPAGMIGLQTALSVLWEGLVQPKLITPENLLWLLTTGPASVLGEKVELKQGINANLVVFNPEARWTFDAQSNRSLSANSPWFGKLLTGKVEQVFLGESRFTF